MTLKVVQITKINGDDFKFTDIENLTLPIPPLASVNFYENEEEEKTLKICATLYINSKESKAPSFGSLTQNKNGTAEIYFDYIWDRYSPETYDVWYIEIDYTSKTVGNITEVTSYLQYTVPPLDGGVGEDPKTSRGTKTSVQD
jgi:hypothetical protein